MYRDISKRVCCTCLSENRQLFQLCRVPDGVNLLFMLLMCDIEAYKEGFFNDTASWMVCWECCAIIKRIKQFRLQTCTALKELKDIADGSNKKTVLKPLSHLSSHINPGSIETYTFRHINIYNVEIIKKENIEDLNSLDNDHYPEIEIELSNIGEIVTDEPSNDIIEAENKKKEIERTKTKVIDVPKINKETKRKVKRYKEFYRVTVMDIEELKNVTDKRKLELKSKYKCDSCVIGFESENDFNDHNLELHTKKENYSPCIICLAYVSNDKLESHTHSHYKIYDCNLCEHQVCAHKLIVGHLKETHKDIGIKKKTLKKDLKPDDAVYPCSECDMSFGNKGAKWKHVQKSHRAGHTCATCQKVFTFKHNLQRHELHKGQHPLTECPQCHKQVRLSLLSAHARTHSERPRLWCAPCGKHFVCRATYENHLKYASAHAAQDMRRHACSSCDKKFRSGGELRDHIAYRHDAQARHKCPVCDKSLATQRCVRRHVRRAHEGIKENKKDKMCDYCGKSFRYKKSLSEHVWRHTGARPLSCGRCGRAFRQRAALYAHARRLHPDN